jgi:hypothetical protein
MSSLVHQLAGARPVFAPRIGGFSPIATDMTPPRCHAGAAHGPAIDRGAAGELCAPCFESLLRFLEAA